MDVAAAKAQAERLTDQAAELDQIKNRVASHRGSTDSAWQASEVPMITGAMETTERQLANKAQELRNIASDIVSVALEIQAEEEAAARAAAAKASCAILTCLGTANLCTNVRSPLPDTKILCTRMALMYSS